jgi:hypothetical protein
MLFQVVYKLISFIDEYTKKMKKNEKWKNEKKKEKNCHFSSCHITSLLVPQMCQLSVARVQQKCHINFLKN